MSRYNSPHYNPKAYKWNEYEKEEAAKMAADDMSQAETFLAAERKATEKAVEILALEFPETGANKWRAALGNPDNVQFSNSQKESRFNAALAWIDTQC